MRNRYAPMVVAIATGLTMACSDAAVEAVTAPKLAATPATPVANRWPSVVQYAQAGIPGAIGMQIAANPRFEDNYNTYVVTVNVSFQLANDVSVKVDAWVQNTSGQVINRTVGGLAWSRMFLPVWQGDTTFTLRVPTHGTTCGLVGKATYEGRAAQVAIDVRLVQINLYTHQINATSAPDVSQPACPPPGPPPPGCDEPASRVISSTGGPATSEGDCDNAPLPPGGGGPNDPVEVCVAVWRQLWIYDPARGTVQMVTQWLLGVVCYTTTL